MSNYEVTFVGAPFVVVVKNAIDATDAINLASEELPRGFVVEEEKVLEISDHSSSYADRVIDAGDES